MRKATYDRRGVICKNARLIGFSTYKATPGSLVIDKDGRYHRVIGRVARTERDGLEMCDGFLLTMRLLSAMDGACACWVNPDDVREIYAPQFVATYQAFFMAKFLSSETDHLLEKTKQGGTDSQWWPQ